MNIGDMLVESGNYVILLAMVSFFRFRLAAVGKTDLDDVCIQLTASQLMPNWRDDCEQNLCMEAVRYN